jgi:hypothetical protein
MPALEIGGEFTVTVPVGTVDPPIVPKIPERSVNTIV